MSVFFLRFVFVVGGGVLVSAQRWGGMSMRSPNARMDGQHDDRARRRADRSVCFCGLIGFSCGFVRVIVGVLRRTHTYEVRGAVCHRPRM